MPAKSKAQFRFMQMLAHDPKKAREHGMTSEQASEYTSENKGSKKYSRLKEMLKKK